jgi:hypothetical protein
MMLLEQKGALEKETVESLAPTEPKKKKKKKKASGEK